MYNFLTSIDNGDETCGRGEKKKNDWQNENSNFPFSLSACE
jgi:hypothetical protein